MDKYSSGATISHLFLERQAPIFFRMGHLFGHFAFEIDPNLNSYLRCDPSNRAISISDIAATFGTSITQLISTRMPVAAEVQFLSVMNECERTSQELSSLKRSMANISSAAKHDQKCNDDNNIILESTNMGVDKQDSGTNTSLEALSDVPTQKNESSERNTISSSMEKAMEELRHERNVISSQLKQLVEDAQSSNQIELVSEEVTKLTEKLKSIEDRLNINGRNDTAAGVSSIEQQAELKSVKQSLSKTKQKLSGYITDVKNLQNAIYTMQDSRVDSAKVECLNDIIKEKNRIIDETKQQLHASKQMNLKLAHERDRQDRFNPSDTRSVSTNSIDRAILRVASNNNSGYDNRSSSRNNNLQQHLEEASRLIFEKDHVISEQNLAITELESKVKSHEQLVKEAESMRLDTYAIRVLYKQQTMVGSLLPVLVRLKQPVQGHDVVDGRLWKKHS